ncbi:MAG: hypothetical protein AAFV53_39695 [Myxococcota bacterium]
MIAGILPPWDPLIYGWLAGLLTMVIAVIALVGVSWVLEERAFQGRVNQAFSVIRGEGPLSREELRRHLVADHDAPWLGRVIATLEQEGRVIRDRQMRAVGTANAYSVVVFKTPPTIAEIGADQRRRQLASLPTTSKAHPRGAGRPHDGGQTA